MTEIENNQAKSLIEKIDSNDEMTSILSMDKKRNMPVLQEVMDLSEASREYDINRNTLKSICKAKRHGLIEGVDFRRSGNAWLITREAMEKLKKVVLKRNRN